MSQDPAMPGGNPPKGEELDAFTNNASAQNHTRGGTSSTAGILRTMMVDEDNLSSEDGLSNPEALAGDADLTGNNVSGGQAFPASHDGDPMLGDQAHKNAQQGSGSQPDPASPEAAQATQSSNSPNSDTSDAGQDTQSPDVQAPGKTEEDDKPISPAQDPFRPDLPFEQMKQNVE